MNISKKPRKQRKKIFIAPIHKLLKLTSAHLSPELREKYGRRSLPIRTGDRVRIMRGEFKGLEGKVTKVDHKRQFVYIENITMKKADGSTVLKPIHASKIVITNLYLDDKYRAKKLEESIKLSKEVS